MKSESPFTLRRFETEHKHLYFLPKKLFARISGRRSVYLIGSRGTGKTTLLKALYWKEQLVNSELQRRLADLNAEPDYIGIYMKIPETMTDLFSEWPQDASEQFRGAVFALYIDLLWIQATCDAIAQLTIEGKLSVSTNVEYETTERLLTQFPELLFDMNVRRPLTVKGFAGLLYEKRRHLERWVHSTRTHDKDEVMKYFPVGQIGAFGRNCAAEFAHLSSGSVEVAREVHFKVCLDESECLTATQQRTVNTLVRLAEAPVSFIISYVRLVDVTETHIKGITLQDADREIVELDQMSDAEFAELAEGVATVRIQRVCQNREKFETRVAFGALDVNELLAGILTVSASPDAKRLLESSLHSSKLPFFGELWDQSSGYPPIYQTYIIQKLRIQPPSPESAKWERRKQESAEIRKRMVAAYLCICKELKTQVKYAGAEMILQISDSCIRDYLSILDSTFSRQKDDVEQFGLRRILIDVQDQAIREASIRKNESIPQSEVGSPLETQRLIEALGLLTNRLQTTLKDEKSLKSPERGRFVLTSDPRSADSLEIFQLITEAAEAGFLKMTVIDERTMKFRLHCSLAAAYSISYRGAYYECVVKQDDLMPIYKSRDPEIRAEKLTRVGDLLLREDPTLPLFEGTT